MKLYNTMTRQKEEFVPMEEGKVITVRLRPYRVRLYPISATQDPTLFLIR